MFFQVTVCELYKVGCFPDKLDFSAVNSSSTFSFSLKKTVKSARRKKRKTEEEKISQVFYFLNSRGLVKYQKGIRSTFRK